MRCPIGVVCCLLLINGCATSLRPHSEDGAFVTADGDDVMAALRDGPAIIADDVPPVALPADFALLEDEEASFASADVEAIEEPSFAAEMPADEPLPELNSLTPQVEVAGDGEALQEMDVPEVLEYALDHHPILRAREQEVDVARAQLVTAGLLPNPQLVMDTESPVHQNDPTELTTRVTFTIPTGGKMRRRKAVAEAGIRRARQTLSREAETVLLDAADAAIEVLYLQELLSLNKQYHAEAVKRANAEVLGLSGQLELGLADKIEVDIDSVLAEVESVETDTRLTGARVVLSRAIGMPPGVFVRMRGALTVDSECSLLPLQSVVAAAERNRPAITEACLTLTESHRLHDLAHAEAKPDLVLGPRYQDPLGEDDDRIGVRFNMDLPIFDRNQGEILESAARIRANRALLETARLSSINDVVAAYMKLRSIQTGAKLFETRTVDLISRYKDLIRDPDIRQGISASQTAEIQQELLTFRKRHLDLRYQYHRLLVRLEVFLGQPIVVEHGETKGTELFSQTSDATRDGSPCLPPDQGSRGVGLDQAEFRVSSNELIDPVLPGEGGG